MMHDQQISTSKTTDSVLLLGGYGNFGKRIATALTRSGIAVIIAGRDRAKADALVAALPPELASSAVFDITQHLDPTLKQLRPKVLINTCGPFQNNNYDVARCCISHGVHYIDIADGRDFVVNITQLSEEARRHDVAVISGASTVPGLSSAVIEHYQSEFSKIESLQFGISPGQQAERGLATTQGILSYVGKPLKPFSTDPHCVYGWQDLYRQRYPQLGLRWMANCDIPDLDLFKTHYEIDNIRFSAGLELGLLHLGLWGLSWLIRLGLPLDLSRFAPALLRMSDIFNRFGSDKGGMHMLIKGQDLEGHPHERHWFIIAEQGHGPHIPTIPAIILARNLIWNRIPLRGAYPCVGLVRFEDYLDALDGLAITSHSFRGSPANM